MKFIVLLVVGCLALCLTSCWTPPGQGPRAQAGYRAAAPVIAALDKFHDERGYYPTNLSELVPSYLPSSSALLVHEQAEPVRSPHSAAVADTAGESNLDWFWYRPSSNSYSLMFHYTGPGMNDCIYDSTTRNWSAHGYY
jgi:hypothetical protein